MNAITRKKGKRWERKEKENGEATKRTFVLKVEGKRT